jgi:hypothetical protein
VSQGSTWALGLESTSRNIGKPPIGIEESACVKLPASKACRRCCWFKRNSIRQSACRNCAYVLWELHVSECLSSNPSQGVQCYVLLGRLAIYRRNCVIAIVRLCHICVQTVNCDCMGVADRSSNICMVEH